MPDRPSLFDSPDLTYRMSMLPGATYRNPDGSERLEWALPSMITEPIDALYRLGQNSVLPDGRLGIPNPGNAENQQDVLTGLLSLYGGNAMNPVRAAGAVAPKLLSDTGKPSLFGSAIAGAESPQRMYHGTGAAEDFTRFKPSESGSFGPGVYLSKDPEFAATHAGADSGSRLMPVDVAGPLASMDDYLTTLHANGRSPEAAQNALLGQGYTGVTGDVGGPGFANVTNVFKPGSIRSATTGETLFSDQVPSLFGAALYGGQDQPESGNAGLGGLFAQNDQGPGEYLQKRMEQPYQPAPGQDFQYRQDPADVNRLQDWIGRHQRHDLPPSQAEELMKRDPEYQRLYRKLWTPQPYDPEPPLR